MLLKNNYQQIIKKKKLVNNQIKNKKILLNKKKIFLNSKISYHYQLYMMKVKSRYGNLKWKLINKMIKKI